MLFFSFPCAWCPEGASFLGSASVQRWADSREHLSDLLQQSWSAIHTGHPLLHGFPPAILLWKCAAALSLSKGFSSTVLVIVWTGSFSGRGGCPVGCLAASPASLLTRSRSHPPLVVTTNVSKHPRVDNDALSRSRTKCPKFFFIPQAQTSLMKPVLIVYISP